MWIDEYYMKIWIYLRGWGGGYIIGVKIDEYVISQNEYVNIFWIYENLDIRKSEYI